MQLDLEIVALVYATGYGGGLGVREAGWWLVDVVNG